MLGTESEYLTEIEQHSKVGSTSITALHLLVYNARCVAKVSGKRFVTKVESVLDFRTGSSLS